MEYIHSLHMLREWALPTSALTKATLTPLTMSTSYVAAVQAVQPAVIVEIGATAAMGLAADSTTCSAAASTKGGDTLLHVNVGSEDPPRPIAAEFPPPRSPPRVPTINAEQQQHAASTPSPPHNAVRGATAGGASPSGGLGTPPPHVPPFPVKATLSYSPSGGNLPALDETTIPQFCLSFATRHFCCAVCRHIPSDCVLLQIGADEKVSCRQCASTVIDGSSVASHRGMHREAPQCVVLAIQELQQHAAPLLVATSSDSLGPTTVAVGPRKIVKVKRPQPGPSITASPLQGVRPTLGLHHDAHGLTAAGTDPSGFAVGIDPNTGLRLPSGGVLRDPIYSREAAKTLQSEEEGSRLQAARDESIALTDLQRRYSQTMRLIRSEKPGCTKQLKSEADTKYERGDYVGSVTLYTKAIEMNDNTTRLAGVYGNRSAAYFMLAKHEECITDCLLSVKLDNGSQASRNKMLIRAVKSSIQLGDLTRAKTLFDQCDATRLTPEQHSDKERVDRGSTLLTKIQGSTALSNQDMEDALRMLVADFGEAQVFRLRLARFYESMKKFERASDVLQRIPPLSLDADCVIALGRLWMNTGFECFDKARELLGQWQVKSTACAAMLAQLNRIDEGKQKGNTLFQNREYADCAEAYTTAIADSAGNERILRILYCNRAAAYKELKRYKEGVEDCTKSLAFDPNFSKAFARRARCHAGLEDFFNAVKDLKAAVALDPTDHDLARELRNAEEAQRREVEKEKDYYHVLGVTKVSADRDIKQRYRDLSLRWHPDKCVSLPVDERAHAERKFKIIGEAYATLIDANKRHEYDLKCEREQVRSGFASSNFGAGGGFFPSRTTAGFESAFGRGGAAFSGRPEAPPRPGSQNPRQYW